MDALRLPRTAVLSGLGILLIPRIAWAGPPYVTDDPEPVEYRHWELYLASQTFHQRDDWT